MEILVQKFGGSSLQSPASRKYAKKHIREAVKQNKKVIVVVSAIGRHPAPYATDSLLKLVNYPKTSASEKELDMLLSTGETISSVVLSTELKEIGIRTTAFTGAQAGIVTNENHTNARIKYINPENIIDAFFKNDVIVVAGFQGRTEAGEITTLGRGGSDTTAAALAVATAAVRVEIFTDVAGIMTADPKIVKNASVLSDCTYIETCNLAYQGAKVIHPQAVEIAMQANIPLHIRSTYLNKRGTKITAKRKITSKKNINSNPVTGIAHSSQVTQIKITKKNNPTYNLTNIFKTLAEANISIDFILISPHQVVFTLPDALINEANSLFKKHDVQADILPNCAKVSVVGAGMTGIPGIAAKIVSVLAKKDIQILQAADSHTTIWVLIAQPDLHKAVNALHDEFKLSEQFTLST